MEATDLARATAQVAARDIGVMEDPPASNRGTRIEEYQDFTGIPHGSAYCASAVSLWVYTAAQETNVQHTFKKSGSALGLVHNNPSLFATTLTPDMIPCVLINQHADGVHGHAALVIGMDDAGTLQTVDPNSDKGGSREGTGVYLLHRRTINDPERKGYLVIK